VFVLSRVEAKKQREIAQQLGISAKALEAHIQRALLELRKVISVWLLLSVIEKSLS
jgi:DNA-directed RNA polymerase specialized sigma24 family protein